jgi:hypothetical protein
MSENEEQIMEEKYEKELQESACAICGKTLKQRMEEGYEFESYEKMVSPSAKWHSPICPVCDDLLEYKVIRLVSADEEWFIEEVERLLRKIKVNFEIEREPDKSEST